jgi:chitinase
MKVNRRRLIFTTLSLLVIVGIAAAGANLLAQKAYHADAASSLPTHYFAPYAEIGEGDSLQTVEQTTGQKYFTLAFVTANGSSCQPSYPTPTSDIAYIRSVGGDVIQSFGGEAGKELAQTCTSASSLQAAYQSVVTKLNLTHLDFDIEGGEESDATTYTRRNTALAALQQANPGLTISFTLPAGTDGLENGSPDLLKNAISQGVNFNMVNLMTMDFGASGTSVGDETVSAANSFYKQLQQIYPSKTSSQLWDMIGLTTLIGQSDNSGEIFTPSDGAQVLSFAEANQIGELSFWAVSRDNGSCSGATDDSDTCDGLSQSSYAFTNSWKSFTSGTPTATSTGGTPTATATSGTPTATSTGVTPTATATGGTPTATATGGTPTVTATGGTSTLTSGPRPVIGTVYNIVNKNSGEALVVTGQSKDNGGGILQVPLVPGQSSQEWTFVSPDPGLYNIVNQNSGKVIDDTNWSSSAGTAMQQWTKAGGDGQSNQKWWLVYAGDGYYYIKSHHDGDVLEVAGQSTADGAVVQQQIKVSGQASQEWKLVAVAP